MSFFRSASVDSIGERKFRGIAATAGVKADGLSLDMAGADLSRARDGRMPLLLNHDVGAIVGRITSARTTFDKLVFEGEFAPSGCSPRADEACAMLKAGFLNCVSSGFDPIQSEPINPNRPRDGRLVTKWLWLEASLCGVPLDPESVVTARARMDHASDLVTPIDDADCRRRQADKLRLIAATYKRSPEHERRLRQAEALRLRWPA